MAFLTSEGTCALNSSQFLSGPRHLPPFISPGLFATGMSCSVLFLLPTLSENFSAQKASGEAQQGEGDTHSVTAKHGVSEPQCLCKARSRQLASYREGGPNVKIALIRGVRFLTVHQGKYKMEKEETRMNSVVLG